MSLLKNIADFSKQISEEIGFGFTALGYENLLKKAKKTSKEVTEVGRQVYGIAQKAEGKFQDRKDCFFWISQVTKQILLNDQLLRKIKHETVYLGTLNNMLECSNVNAAEFAIQFSNELKREQANSENLKNQLEATKRRFNELTASKTMSKILYQNKKAAKNPFGFSDKEIPEILGIINSSFPIFIDFDGLGLISTQLRSAQVSPSSAVASDEPQDEALNENAPTLVTNRSSGHEVRGATHPNSIRFSGEKKAATKTPSSPLEKQIAVPHQILRDKDVRSDEGRVKERLRNHESVQNMDARQNMDAERSKAGIQNHLGLPSEVDRLPLLNRLSHPELLADVNALADLEVSSSATTLSNGQIDNRRSEPDVLLARRPMKSLTLKPTLGPYAQSNPVKKEETKHPDKVQDGSSFRHDNHLALGELSHLFKYP